MGRTGNLIKELETRIQTLERRLANLTDGVNRLENRTYRTFNAVGKRGDGIEAKLLILARSAGLEA